MAFDGTSGPCWEPDIPLQMDQEQRLQIASFGDGYEQRMLDGINSLMVRWQVTFENRPSDMVVEMVDYLVARQGRAFPFHDPVLDATYNVFCDEWSVTWPIKRVRSGAREYYGTLSAEFRKANGVTVTA